MKPADPAIRAEALELRKVTGTHSYILSGNPAYGRVCGCGAQKSLNAAMCAQCRLDLKRGKPVTSAITYDLGLLEVWPMPVAFPPVLAQPPRVHLWDRGEREHA